MKPFRFKQFTVEQDRCAMKIGTDGVLLGAWVSLDKNPFSILDIGAGTGIIALQLAQRSYAPIIDALEIDPNAYEQCVDNFENSPWADRLFCYHASLEAFIGDPFSAETGIEYRYDLIISNPPFYSEDFRTSDPWRAMARFTNALPFDELIASASRLLSDEGILAVILPQKEEEKFIMMASEKNLFPNRICRVRGNETSEEKRSMLEFCFEKISPKTENLIIETSRHNYTEAYKKLVGEFYLKM